MRAWTEKRNMETRMASFVAPDAAPCSEFITEEKGSLSPFRESRPMTLPFSRSSARLTQGARMFILTSEIISTDTCMSKNFKDRLRDIAL